MARSTSTSRDLRHRVLTCMTKLSDRDTHASAVAELESIIPTLSGDTFSLFINSLSSTSSADRAAVRAASLRLLAALAAAHGRALSPHLPKLVSAVVRRLRDNDSAVRNAAASAAGVFSAATSAFSVILRPLADSLATEQETTAQAAAAMCVAAVIDAAPEESIDGGMVGKMMPKWMKMLRNDAFKAKSAMIMLIRSAMRVCEIANCEDMVKDLVEFLKSEDWQARKAAAEALKDIATIAERDSLSRLSELKANCLKNFEARKFDRVKAVREAMIQMVEAWKEIPDVCEDGSPPPKSQASSKENASDGRYPARSRISSVVDSNTPQTRRKHVPLRQSSPSDSALKTTAANRGAPKVVAKRSSAHSFRKLDFKKHSSNHVEAADSHHSSVTPVHEDSLSGDDQRVLHREDVRTSKTEMRRGLFSKPSGSRVVPYPEENSEANAGVNNVAADTCRHHNKDCEDLSVIRRQLVQIENQQSSLMDVLQKFIGSSRDGMHTLETRVHGLEQALDDISYDLAVSTARMSSIEPARTSCCLLPGPDFLSSKFWRRQEARASTSRLSFSGTTPLVSAMRNMTDKSPISDARRVENRRFHLHGAGGVIVNPLAQMHGDPRGPSEASSSRVLKSVHGVA